MDDPGAMKKEAKRVGVRQEYGWLLAHIAREADKITLRYFRAEEATTERKKDGTPVTQADCEVEMMARAKAAASGLSMDVLGEEMSQKNEMGPLPPLRARLIIDSDRWDGRIFPGHTDLWHATGSRETRRDCGGAGQRAGTASPLVGVSR